MERPLSSKNEKQSIYEIFRACRLCGAGGGYKMPIIQNIPIDVDDSDVELRQKIRDCVQIEVNQSDKMPPLICELCVDKVNDFYEFLDMCRQTNKRTRLRLGLPPQTLPRGAPDAADCILGVTEQVYANEDSNDVPLSKKIAKPEKAKKFVGPARFKKQPTPEPEVVVTRRTAKTEVPRPSKGLKQTKFETRTLRDSTTRTPPRAPTPPARRTTRQTNEDDREESINLSKLKLQAKNKDNRPTLSKTSPKGILKNSIKTEESPLLKPRSKESSLLKPKGRESSLLKSRGGESSLLKSRDGKSSPLKARRGESSLLKARDSESSLLKSRSGESSLLKTRGSSKRPMEKERLPRVPMKKVKIAIKPVPAKSIERRRAPTPPPPPPTTRRSAPPAPPAPPPAPAPEPERQQHACFVCNTDYSNRSCLTNHMKTHTVLFTPMKQACNPCRDWFPTLDKSVAHHRWHARTSTPYHCDICTADFKHHSAYNLHFEYNTCLPSTEVPDLKCPDCWGLYPTQTLMDQHRCPGEAARPGGKCCSCQKNFATLRTLRKHEESCRGKRTSDSKVRFSDEVRERMRPVYVRFSRCDPLLEESYRKTTDGHYDVYGVEQYYDLDDRYVYPYSPGLSRVHIKTEPVHYDYDDMVHIQDEIKHELMDLDETFVHWDSDDSNSSDDDVDLRKVGYAVSSPFARRHKPIKVDSLSRLSIKTIFSNSFLGKVPKRKRKLKTEVKAECGFDSLFNIKSIQSVETTNLDKSLDSINTFNTDVLMTGDTESKSNGDSKSEDVSESLKGSADDTETKSLGEESNDSGSMIKDYSIAIEVNVTEKSADGNKSECAIENAENRNKNIDDKVSNGSSNEQSAFRHQKSDDAKQNNKEIGVFDVNSTEQAANGTVGETLDTTPNNDIRISENKENIEFDNISNNEPNTGVNMDDMPQENVNNIDENKCNNETNTNEKPDDMVQDDVRRDDDISDNVYDSENGVNSVVNDDRKNESKINPEEINEDSNKLEDGMDLDEGGTNRGNFHIASDDIQINFTDKSVSDKLDPIEGKNREESVSDDIQDSFTDRSATDKLGLSEDKNGEESAKIVSDDNLLNGDTKDFDRISDKDFEDFSDTELDDKKLLEALDEQIDDIGRRNSVEENVVNDHLRKVDPDVREDSNIIKEDVLNRDDKIEDIMEVNKEITQDPKGAEEKDKSEDGKSEDTAQSDSLENPDLLDKISNNDITEEREKFLLEDRPMEEFSEVKDKICMGDIIRKNIDSMDLDNISDEEFDFDA